MKYFSEQEGCWFEGESIWNGRESLDRFSHPDCESGYQQRGNALMDAAPSVGYRRGDILDLQSRGGSGPSIAQQRRQRGLCASCGSPSETHYRCAGCRRVRRPPRLDARNAAFAKRELAELEANPDADLKAGLNATRKACGRRCGRKVSRGDTKAGYVFCGVCRSTYHRGPRKAA